ncbi:probable glycosyltransferase At5g25310 [Mangifera indica]|uniref:probable glycosyltransferase At5g25310 n=1 Tax=Mangifera indica TaxID=29780 RepID=UPI001CFB4371|nr:probable glycosyltransferase At5g25310 [Mangifera indica]
MASLVASVLSFCTLVFIVIVLVLSAGYFSSFMSHSSFEMVRFRRAASLFDLQSRGAHFTASSDGVTVNCSRNSTPVKRKSLSKGINKREKLKQGLARSRASIRRAALTQGFSSIIRNEEILHQGDIYRNPGAFYQSYAEMEKKFKVYVYEEGEPPMAHDGPCKEMYSIEGRFINELEHGTTKFRTSDPDRAHVYFLPFSVTLMVEYLYKPLSYDTAPLQRYVADYVKMVSTRHPFWNRTSGADHFMLACHDWGPLASEANPQLYNRSIRALCNANSSEGFNPQKDVSIPELHLCGGYIPTKLRNPPPLTETRPHLAFFAGGVHGPIRPILLKNWKGRDNDMKVFEYLPKKLDYYSLMLQSKFCLCPSGYEVASPRVVESIYAECIPVILSENFVLPLSDVLRWESFSVQVNISDIPRLKEVLRSISEEKYMKLKENLRAVRGHFMLNIPAKRFDAFHMILHSIWLRRLNIGFS